MNKRKMIQCATAVNKSAIRRENIDGVEHIVVSSFTLPDNIVMNGGLYPAEEIEKGFATLQRTLAPIEHPTDSQGNFVSASDPEAIHNFHAGAFNDNVTRENGRVHIDKFINVQEALKSDRGRRLLDRINEIETSESPRPVHTSVGVFVEVEETDGVQTNAAGDKFTWIARNMFFDHDAILLDSVGAAQPGQGVGLAVNSDGQELEVDQFTICSGSDEDAVSHSTLDQHLEKIRANAEGLSFGERGQSIRESLERSVPGFQWIEDIFDDEVIYWSSDDLFSVPYVLDETTKRTTIVGIPVPVERSVTFQPKVNKSEEGEAMKDLILNALKAANVDTDGMDDVALFKAYNQLQANQSESDDSGAADNTAKTAEVVANAVAAAMKPITDQLASVEAKLNKQDSDEHEKLAGIIANSGKFPGLDEEAAKLLPVAKLRELAANCGQAFGVPLAVNSGHQAEEFQTQMPE